jgi:hypothetical protein
VRELGIEEHLFDEDDKPVTKGQAARSRDWSVRSKFAILGGAPESEPNASDGRRLIAASPYRAVRAPSEPRPLLGGEPEPEPNARHGRRLIASGPPRRVKAPSEPRPLKELLLEFLTLDVNDETKVLRFARKWGTLELCEHVRWRRGCPLSECSVPTPPHIPYEESLAAWGDLILRFGNALRIARTLQANHVPEAVLWTPLSEAVGPSILWSVPLESQPLERHRHALAFVLNGWMASNGIVVEFSWRERPELQFAGSLLATLTSQLVAEVSGAPGLFFCNGGCGLPFIPEHRAPKRNSRTWCPACRVRTRGNQAQRDYAERRSSTKPSSGTRSS